MMSIKELCALRNNCCFYW